MIFWFSGTGNSLYAAQKLSAKIGDERLIDMAQAVNSGAVEYSVSERESIGFVFPVYYGTLPVTVRRFINAMSLKDAWGKYVWAVVTCGSEMMAMPKYLSAELEKNSINLSAVFELKMPDNYVIMYNPSSRHAAIDALNNADEKLPVIGDKIKNRIRTGIHIGLPEKVLGAAVSKFYDKWRNTDKFYVNDRCIACGLCEKICPEKVIEIKDRKPVWVKDKCAHCVGCISRCPVFAIEYGKATEKRRRYINPVF